MSSSRQQSVLRNYSKLCSGCPSDWTLHLCIIWRLLDSTDSISVIDSYAFKFDIKFERQKIRKAKRPKDQFAETKVYVTEMFHRIKF